VIGVGPRALMPFGITLAVICVLILLLMFGIRALVDVEVSGASKDAASSAFGVVVSNLRTTLILATIVGVVCAVAGGIVKRRAA
jgi:ABC-type Fe3+ transport system permease subunit